jgi:hypothetical protein
MFKPLPGITYASSRTGLLRLDASCFLTMEALAKRIELVHTESSGRPHIPQHLCQFTWLGPVLHRLHSTRY